MTKRLSSGIVCVAVLLLLLVVAVSAAEAKNAKSAEVTVRTNHAYAETTGATATSTATCPKRAPRGEPPWRAAGGGFSVNAFYGPFGSEVVYESRKVGQRSWRVSVQSLAGRVGMSVKVRCQLGAPRTSSASTTVPTAGSPAVGPMAVATCRAGTGVATAGGFSTPPPNVGGGSASMPGVGAANVVIGSYPASTRAWNAEVVSSQASSLTGYVYCAKLKPTPRLVTASSSEDVAGDYYVRSLSCGKRRVLGSGFSETGVTAAPAHYLVPRTTYYLVGSLFTTATRTSGPFSGALNAFNLCG
jgi:hypothetical protein